MSEYGVPDDEMRDGFPRGLPGAGSHGDPRLDVLLTEEVEELLLDGWPRHTSLSPELRPLRESVDALRAAPSASELRGEARAMAAFRGISGLAGGGLAGADDRLAGGGLAAGAGGLAGAGGGLAAGAGAGGGLAGLSGGMAHTLPLEIPRDVAGRRQRRAKHRARPEGRPAGRPAGLSRPAMRRRRALGTVAAVALVAIFGIFAYAGSLPGPIQNAAHVAIGAPPVKTATASASAPSVEATGSARESRSPLTGARQIRQSMTPAPAPSANAAPDGPRQWCRGYFANPWKPGATSWDKSDFEKLSKLAPGGSAGVLWYCSKYLDDSRGQRGMASLYPTGFSGGSWAWPPDQHHDDGRDKVPGAPGNVTQTGSASRPRTITGSGDGPRPSV